MKILKFILLFAFFSTLHSCSKDIDDLDTTDQSTISTKRQLFLDGWMPPNGCKAGSLTIFVDPCLSGTPWINGINAAINSYNAADFSINFSMANNATEADIHIDCAAFANECQFGLGEWPIQDFTIGHTIYLSTNDLSNCAFICDNPPSCFYHGVVMHEIGHNLGLGHNEFGDGLTWAVGSFTIDANGNPIHNGATNTGGHIPGTAAPGTTDPGSIMNSNANCDISCTFNDNDLLALQTYYPELIITGPDKLCVGEFGTFCLSEDIDDIKWSFPPTSIQAQEIGNNCLTFTTNPIISSQTITIHAIIGDCIVTKDVIITSAAPCLPPSVPPIQFDNICMEETVCYDFGNFGCIEYINVVSSSQKVTVEIDGTEVCLTSIFPTNQNITLTVTTENICGNGGTTTWDITTNDPQICGGFNPQGNSK